MLPGDRGWHEREDVTRNVAAVERDRWDAVAPRQEPRQLGLAHEMPLEQQGQDSGVGSLVLDKDPVELGPLDQALLGEELGDVAGSRVQTRGGARHGLLRAERCRTLFHCRAGEGHRCRRPSPGAPGRQSMFSAVGWHFRRRGPASGSAGLPMPS